MEQLNTIPDVAPILVSNYIYLLHLCAANLNEAPVIMLHVYVCVNAEKKRMYGIPFLPEYQRHHLQASNKSKTSCHP